MLPKLPRRLPGKAGRRKHFIYSDIGTYGFNFDSVLDFDWIDIHIWIGFCAGKCFLSAAAAP